MNNAPAYPTPTLEAPPPKPWDDTVKSLYTEHFDRLVTQIARFVGDQTVAEDAVQDAFLAYQAKGNPAAPGRELAYIATAARNNALQWFRGESRRREIVDAHHCVAAAPRSAEDEAMLAWEAGELSLKIDSLPERQARVVVLRHVGGMSVAETAAHLGVAAGTVKTHSHRALHHLRGALTRSAA